MEHISYNTSGTCARKIEIDVENGIVVDVKFIGGCSGNTQGVAASISEKVSVSFSITNISNT